MCQCPGKGPVVTNRAWGHNQAMDLIAQARQHSLGDLPRRTAQRVPSKLAIVDGEIRYTHLEFADLVDRTAAGISPDGIVKGDRVRSHARREGNEWVR